MPFINLIAEQRMMARRAERRSRIAFMAFVGSVCTVLACFGVVFLMTETTAGEVGRLREEVRKLEPIRKEISLNREALADLSARLTTLEDAQGLTARWARILNHLSVQTPTSMWLTSIRSVSSDPTKPITTSFQGLTGRLEPVGEFILRLQRCNDLQSVNLKYVNEKISQQGRGMEFEISADIAGTEETQALKKPGAKA